MKDDCCTIIQYLRSIICGDVEIYELEEMDKIMSSYCTENNISESGVLKCGFYDLKLYPRFVFEKVFNEYYKNDDGVIV